MCVYRNIVNAFAVSNVTAAAAVPQAERIFGYTISDASHIVMMVCAIISVAISLFLAALKYKRGD